MNSARKKVESRDQLIDLIFELLDDNDGVEWENETVYSYLQALAAWLNDAGGFYRHVDETVEVDEPTWQLFADALQAAVDYE